MDTSPSLNNGGKQEPQHTHGHGMAVDSDAKRKRNSSRMKQHELPDTIHQVKLLFPYFNELPGNLSEIGKI